MNGRFPVVLQLRGRRCVVIGGGAIAERKALSLVDAGADELLLITPSASPALVSLAEAGALQLHKRSFAASDLEGAFLVFAATNDRAANERIVNECLRLGILVNVADESEAGSFISPSVIRRGDLLLAVTASGASPSLSRLIGKELGERYGMEYVDICAALRRLRELAMVKVQDESARREVLKLAAEDAVSTDNWNMESGEWLGSLIHRMDRRA